MGILFWRRPLPAPPPPFPNTSIGRRLYATYTQEAHVQLKLPHEVRYLAAGGTVTIQYDSHYDNRITQIPILEECCLLITQNRVFPQWLSNIYFYYAASTTAPMDTLYIDSIRVNDEEIPLPVALAS